MISATIAENRARAAADLAIDVPLSVGYSEC